MSGQRHATMVAAATLALTLTPLAGIFEGLGWTIPVLVVVAVVATAGSLVRSGGRGQGLQTLAMVGALTVLMTVMFNGGTAIAFLIPTPSTFGHWLNLVGQGVNDIVVMTPPVAPEGGILFLTMMGVGIVAILHDMFVVGLRTPALAGLTLLTMYLVPVSVAPEATAWFWFILPAVAYLWILADDNLRRVSRFGHRFTGTGHLVGPRFPSPLASTARVAGAVFVTLTLLLLAVVPTNTSGLVDQVAQGYGDGDGPGGGDLGSLDPWAQLSGSLNRPEPVDVLRVTTDDDTPRYLRMHIADVLTDSGFHPSSYDDFEPLDSLSGGDGEVFTAEVENLELVDQVAPVYGRPASVDLDADQWGVEPDTGVIASENSSMEDVDEYTVQYTDPDWEASTLAAAGNVSPDDPVFERNTKHPNVPELSGIVDQIMSDAGAGTVHEKTLAVLDYLSPANGFSYTLETTEAGNEEAVLDFLETKKGYCQQYAAAMAWMLREADVPARVAIGLTKGTYSEGVWTVSSDNFHAWVEVYYEGLGWVVFDPTPSSGVSGSTNFPWAADPSEESDPTDQDGAAPDDDPTDSAPTEAPTLPEELETGGGELPDDQAAAGETDGTSPAWLALLLLLAVPFVPALWRAGLRRSRMGPKRLSAQTAWDETHDLAVDYGVELPESLTPRQAAAVLAQAVPDAREAAGALASAVEHHRYSPRGADATALPDAVRDLRTLLDKNAHSKRFAAIFWPASLAARFAEQRGRVSTRLTDLRAKAPWPRRSNNGGDEAVAGRP